MSNVIDALKRLERIGSEDSKTIQKIISAARDLSEKIVSCYPEGSGDDFVVVDNRIVRNDEGKPLKVNPMKYRIGRNEGEHWHGGLYNEELRKFVDEDRSAALAFARDIANGLLDHIQKDLEKRLAEDRVNLPVLESALAANSAQKVQHRPPKEGTQIHRTTKGTSDATHTNFARSTNTTYRLLRRHEVSTPTRTFFSRIDPQLAEELLELNIKNRGVQTVGAFGTFWGWKVTGQPLIFDIDGVLRNGQHTLQAIVAAGRPVTILVFWGIQDDAFATP